MAETKKTPPKQAICITLGEQSVTHIGMQTSGNGPCEHGYSPEQLEEVAKKYDAMGGNYVLYELNTALGKVTEPSYLTRASVLVLRDGVNVLTGSSSADSDLLQELTALEWDKKYWDTRRQKVLNKRARYNLCFGDDGMDVDYTSENKHGTVVSYADVPLLTLVKEHIEKLVGEDVPLQAEGNYYYDAEKCGIGYHGDTERKKVCGISVTDPGVTRSVHWQWYQYGKPVGKNYQVDINSGDIYFMTEKAAGSDWKKRNAVTLRHAAATSGSKYLIPK